MSRNVKAFFDSFAPQNADNTIKYQKWQNNCSDKIEKLEIIKTVADAFSEFKKQLQYFLVHTHVKRKQASHSLLRFLNMMESMLLCKLIFLRMQSK